MSMSRHMRRSILTAYGLGLRLYPAEFQGRHAAEMLHCADAMLSESNSNHRTVLLLVEDFFRSLLMETFVMTIPRIPQLAILLSLTTFIAGTGYLISHQVLRMSANDPQIQLAEDAASRMTEGENTTDVVPERRVDIASSLAPFVIVYDDSGRPIASSAYLDGSIPAPPRGVFEFVRSNHEERVTWQPRPGVRIASVMTRTPRGFVVAGRNMREVEMREALVFKLAAMGWLVASVALTALWLLMPLFGGSKTPQLRVTV